MTERPSVVQTAVTGEAGLVVTVAAEPTMVTGVGLTETSPVLTVGTCVVWRTET